MFPAAEFQRVERERVRQLVHVRLAREWLALAARRG